MRPFATNLRARAAQLGLTHNDVARRADLSERRIGNYFADAREPDLATVVKLAAILGVTPNDLLLPPAQDRTAKDALVARLVGLASSASLDELRIVVTQAEALLLRER